MADPYCDKCKTIWCSCPTPRPDAQDAARYRWLVGARTRAECDDENAVCKPALPQDQVIAELASWYCTKADADALIDAAIASTQPAPPPDTSGTAPPHPPA